MTTHLISDHYKTEIGTLITVFDAGILCALDFTEYEDRMHRLLRKSYPHYQLQQENDPFGFRAVINSYLAGDGTAFEATEVKLTGTEFQKQVWQALRGIPTGTTMSYGDLSHKIGRPKAVRALGHANSQNPIALVVPCHRVIGQDGSLTGYAGGLERKKWLLHHEGAL